MNNKKYFGLASFIMFAVLAFSFGFNAFAQITTNAANITSTPGLIEEPITNPENITNKNSNTKPVDDLFEAKVIEILEERPVSQPDGSVVVQQKVKMRGLKNIWKDFEFEFNGISEIIAVSGNVYKKGDHVLVNHQIDSDGNDVYYIADYIRRWPLYFLAFLFALTITVVGKARGFRSLIALIISFLIILKGTIPLILAGWNPLAVGILTCILIFIFLIYITDGWNHKSHLAILSLAVAMVIVALLSWIFTYLTRLTGTSSEETLFLIGIGEKAIDFKGLFLAGVLIGALGVLDDIVIGQIEAVEQIKKANPKLPVKQTFKLALDVGNAHIGAMVNTLFLAYAGASLPLLILFSINEPPFLTFGQVINSELIAGEIVRTLVGSLGIALAMPLATYLAASFYKPKNSNSSS
ncbi:MAG: YibE/F family protein [Patescibacteria group bacterium]|nr:YibE/F family protein [Patescibacteria group bacterium]